MSGTAGGGGTRCPRAWNPQPSRCEPDPCPQVDVSRMKPKEREIIKQWILEGAKYDKYWAYEQPEKSPVPNEGMEWSTHWIDRFVYTKLRENEMKPSPDADRVTLVRRLHFDLTGLPPHPDEADAFTQDKRPLDQVVADRVDALLAKRRKAPGLSLRALRKNMRSAMAGKHRNGSSSGAPSSAVRLMTPMEKRVGGRSGAFSNSGDLWTEPHLIQRLSKKKTRNGHLEQQQSNKHGKMPPPPKAVYEVEIDTATELLRESHFVHTARSMLVNGSRK